MISRFGPRPKPIADRFWPKVDPNGPLIIETPCWVWAGYICTETGYGKLANRPGAPIGAHVAGYRIQVGPVPDGLLVRHRCDNRACVRGDHLVVGTQSDNMRDAVDRGRQRPSGCRGERIGNALLTDAAVARIKARLAGGEKGRHLAREYGVSEAVISSVKTQRAWRHVA